jgi:hypothetical protein
LRLPETCNVDLAEEEAEGVAEDIVVRNQACGVDDVRELRAQDPGRQRVGLSATISAINCCWRNRQRLFPYIVCFGAVVRPAPSRWGCVCR